MQDYVDVLKGVGDKINKDLNESGIYTVNDLYLTMPSRYITYIPKSLDMLDEGYNTIFVKVLNNITIIKIRGSIESAVFYAECDGVKIKVIAFGRAYIKYNIHKDDKVLLYGKYNKDKKEFFLDSFFKENFNEKIDPIYPIKNVSNKLISKFEKNIYDIYKPKFEDLIPKYILEKYRLLSYNDYLYKAHFPETLKDIKEVERRKKYEEYLKFSIKMAHLSYGLNSTIKKEKEFDIDKINTFINNLSYSLTVDQKKAIDDILDDLKSNKVMNRFLCGDVGSGKTVVAFVAAYATILAGYQVAFMVPSEVLSIQHYNTALKLFDSKASVALINGGIKKSERLEILKKLKNKEIDLIIGTHSLISDDLEIGNLGLIIIDEQHRFGVRQRAKLQNKSSYIDSLFLSATPIPRSLMLKEFGALTYSNIKTKPEGRLEVLTKVVNINDSLFYINAINKNVTIGHQVFVVAPKIFESPESDIYNVYKVYDLLKNKVNGKILVMHGGLKEEEKKDIMEKFQAKKADVLISTTIIEVGVDIKDATLMVIFNAEMFGLSTIHQLRGRVGRNSFKSGCLLLTRDINNERLNIICNNYDCFTLAEEDLKMRGPGEILGVNQSGVSNYDSKDSVILSYATKDGISLYNDYISGKNNYKIISEVIKEIKDENINLN